MSAFADKSGALNDAILATFGDESTVEITRADTSTESVGVVWLASDGDPSPIRAQCKASAFTGALPRQNDTLTRNGIIYRIQGVERRSNDWLSMELRILPSSF